MGLASQSREGHAPPGNGGTRGSEEWRTARASHWRVQLCCGALLPWMTRGLWTVSVGSTYARACVCVCVCPVSVTGLRQVAPLGERRRSWGSFGGCRASGATGVHLLPLQWVCQVCSCSPCSGCASGCPWCSMLHGLASVNRAQTRGWLRPCQSVCVCVCARVRVCVCVLACRSKEQC